MRYDISNHTAPKMPNLGKGTECIKILLLQASKDMQEPLVPMLFHVLGAHISGAEFQYPDLTWKEPTGMMANLVGDSGCNEGQLSNLVEDICRDIRQHDEAELKKLVEWSKILRKKLPKHLHIQKINNRKSTFIKETCLRHTPWLTLITTEGLAPGKYTDMIQSVVTQDALFT